MHKVRSYRLIGQLNMVGVVNTMEEHGNASLHTWVRTISSTVEIAIKLPLVIPLVVTSFHNVIVRIVHSQSTWTRVGTILSAPELLGAISVFHQELITLVTAPALLLEGNNTNTRELPGCCSGGNCRCWTSS